MKNKHLKNRVMGFGFPLRFLALVVGNCPLLGAYENPIADPADAGRDSCNLAVIEGNVDPFEPGQGEVVEADNHFLLAFGVGSGDSLDEGRAVVDVLFFPVVIVAEEIAAADDKDEVFFDKHFDGVLELQAEELVIVEEVEAAELVPGEEEDLGVVEGVEGEDVFADGEGGGLGLGVGNQLVGVGLVDEGGVG